MEHFVYDGHYYRNPHCAFSPLALGLGQASMIYENLQL